MIFWIELLLLISFLLYLLHLYTSKDFDHWKKRNVPFMKPKPFMGNMLDMLLQKKEMGRFFASFYEQMDVPFLGLFIFSKPALLIKDVHLLKRIMVTDFDHFVDRNLYTPDFDPAVAHMLFNEKGDEWRVMRSKMSPFFSPSKTKSMFGAVDDLAKSLCTLLLNEKEGSDAKEISNKYTVGVIAKCVFGVDAKTLENEDAEFVKMANKVFDSRPITCFRFLSYFLYHPFAHIFKVRMFDPEVIDFLGSVFWECLKEREEKNIRGNDLVDIIADLRKNKDFCELYKFEGDKVISQALIFFVAGFETTGTALAFTLYALCLHLDIQGKLKKNIKEVLEKHNGQLNVESIEEMDYLDMVVKESMRLYLPTPTLNRVCTSDYKIPGTEVEIDKGTIIIIPALAIQMDPKHFPKPEEFIPERFESLDEDITFLPFGHGPRNCIGSRFGLLMVKLAIVRVLQNFEVQPTDETPLTVVFNPRTFIPQPMETLSLKFVQVDPLF